MHAQIEREPAKRMIPVLSVSGRLCSQCTRVMSRCVLYFNAGHNDRRLPDSCSGGCGCNSYPCYNALCYLRI